VTRRRFAAALPAATLFAQDAPLSAKQVIEKIREHLGVAWREPTVDTIKAGNPDAPVKGIATTVMATLDVLQRAAKQGRNLVITHEPTFYNHEDKTQDFEKDPVYQAKQDLIAKNNMVVFRFHDNWHAHRPDLMLTGLAARMGFTHSSTNPRLYEIPETTLDKVARQVQSRLKDRNMRVVGKPGMKVSRIIVNPGYASLMGPVRGLADADLFIAGEAREWEGVEYVFDAVAAGQNKALILLGHAISEDPGMEDCAQWLKTFLPGMPIEFVPAGEPFWRP
jgi:putative NIF3 family GTP cyclohydrolase 1 type 2